ncbi:AsnC family transcriptional regulator [Thioclava sp. SK-1]|uniref:GntR family transcriptional regulator n=1 Tax=Thioclava sp. SK-1 TaxID=1889770 RepID=UPI0008266726|nr:GntR family transcriptional regulator [Thioclava sp. SK-1]OCX60996.1 AsnC family transcriptional regulator [Thioclava sp. SK-1]
MTNTSKTATLICTEIERRIAAGAYSDGEKLSEQGLAAEFAVSRTPLREALQILQGLGHVELIPNRGAFVRRPSITRLVEMFEVMAEMEAWCVRLATARITPAQRLYLRQAATDCDKALAANNPEAYFEANGRLHGTIYEASGNSVLMEETQRMVRRLRPFRRSQLNLTGRLEASMREHDEILNAIEENEPERAAALMRAHINILSQSYDQYLAQIEGLPGHTH